MPIKRFYATADTTITNAYREDLSTRGDGSNMGQADTLEVFSLFDQVETARKSVDGSSTIVPERELARILIKFDTADIITDPMTSFTGNPYAESNSKFILRMSNAVHGKTLPDNFTVDVFALDTAFDEGYGIDADEYRDSGTIGQVAAASWTSAAYDAAPLTTPATGSFHVDIEPDGNFTVEVGGHDVTVTPQGNATDTAAEILSQLGTAPFDALVTASITTAGQVDLESIDIGGNFITLSVTLDTGDTGIVLVNSDDWTGIGTGGTSGVNHLEGGTDTVAWTTEGGDFGTNTPTPIASQTFVDGDEDLEIDITSYIIAIANDTDGLAGGYADLGLLIKMSATEEALLRSFYTKKFFARSSEYFFLRPCIEVRRTPGYSDGRGMLYATHPMYADSCRLTYTHYVDGELDIPVVSPDRIQIYTDSEKNVSLRTEVVTNDLPTGVNGSGFQTQNLISVDTVLHEVYVEWYADADPTEILFSETVPVRQREIKKTLTTPKYVISMPNLKPSYLGKDHSDTNAVAEVARFRLFVRPKDWSPNIYSKATKELEPEIMTEAYYKVVRMADDFVVIDYGVGNTDSGDLLNDNHTRLRFDSGGNFFDLDMSLLERGFSYGIKFMFVLNGERREQKEVFKFRVE